MSSEADLFDHIRSLEMRLLDRAVRACRESLDQLLAPEFAEFGSSGRIFDKESVIALLLEEPTLSFEIFDLSVARLGPDAALATYRATARGGDGGLRESIRSSVWIRNEAVWRLRFHQGTPLGE